MAYIKQEVVTDKFEKLKEQAETLRDKIYLDGVLAVIENIPTADVVEVVRCKDCKHWIYWADSKTCSCKIHHIRTMKDDFCSYGERRTDNDL